MTGCAICSTSNYAVPVRQGALCDDCANGILSALRQIEIAYGVLDPLRGRGESGRSAPGRSSASPADDGVIVERDRRSKITFVTVKRDGRDREDTRPAALAAVSSWCRQVAYQRDARQPDIVTMTRECAFLRVHHRWIIEQPWVDAYAAEIEQVRYRLLKMSGLGPDSPVGRCIELDCKGLVFVTEDREGLFCARCARTYYGVDLARLRAAQGSE